MPYGHFSPDATEYIVTDPNTPRLVPDNNRCAETEAAPTLNNAGCSPNIQNFLFKLRFFFFETLMSFLCHANFLSEAPASSGAAEILEN